MSTDSKKETNGGSTGSAQAGGHPTPKTDAPDFKTVKRGAGSSRRRS